MSLARKLLKLEGKWNLGMLQSQNVRHRRRLQRTKLTSLIIGWTCTSRRLLTRCHKKTRCIYRHGWLRHSFMRNSWKYEDAARRYVLQAPIAIHQSLWLAFFIYELFEICFLNLQSTEIELKNILNLSFFYDDLNY